MRFEDLVLNECRVNSSKLAGRPDEHLDQTPVLNYYCKRPQCDHTALGKTASV